MDSSILDFFSRVLSCFTANAITHSHYQSVEKRGTKILASESFVVIKSPYRSIPIIINIAVTLCIFTSNKCFRRSNQRNFAQAFVSAKVPARCKPCLSPGQTSKSFNGETNYRRCRYTHLHGHGSWISVTCIPMSPSFSFSLAPSASGTQPLSGDNGWLSSFEAWKLKNFKAVAVTVTGLNAPGSSCRARVHS